MIARLVRQAAAAAPAVPIHESHVVGCWVSPGWSRDLSVRRRDGWHDVDLGPDGPAGLALVLVARAGRPGRVSVAGFLVDTFCLGVKNAIGPEQLRKGDLPEFVRTYFAAFPSAPLPAPLELAQHLVHGAVAFADGLGFQPHPDFYATHEHVGAMTEPCAITFGQRGRPFYVAGPHDDPIAVMSTLKVAVGHDGFTMAAA